MFTIHNGDKVYSRTPAGLQLADVPCDGTYHQNQNRNVTSTLKGEGVVVAICDIEIDYDTWPSLYEGIGKIPYRNCLVVHENGSGWAGEGALIKPPIIRGVHMKNKLHHCDGCGKDRRDVISCGRDANGDPDAPDLCFICRKESGRGRIYDKQLGKYVRMSELPLE